jgi:hypothetical protein
MPATQAPLLNGSGHSTHAGNGAPADWYDDPSDPSIKRYWDGQSWTEHVARPSQATHRIQTPPPVGNGSRRGFFGWVSQRPALAFWSTLAVALVVGIGLGASSAEQQNTTSAPDSELSTELDDARDEVGTLKDDLSDTEADLTTTREKLSTTRDRLRDARADASKPVPALPDEADEPAPGGGPSAKSFSGNGGKNIGTVTVTEESVLEWTNDGDIFQLWDDGFGMSVNSQASSGDTVLPAGTYKNVEVNAIGNWTIEISPR